MTESKPAPAAAGDCGLQKAAELLLNARKVWILSHASPDGDTLGSSFALCRALRKTGRRARVLCSDEIPMKYAYLFEGLEEEEFEPDLVISSDIASVNLFGSRLEPYADRVDLCIDHHPSNTRYARFTFLRPAAAATCEIMIDVIKKLDVDIDRNIANCIYTGLSTDTGCFRYSNTTPATLRTAAEMIERGADSAAINKVMFETISRQRLAIESMALDTLTYYFNDRAAMISITCDMCGRAGVGESELEGLPSMPAKIEGVLAGITVKEKCPGVYKISVRTNGNISASEICSSLGGGGHFSAAGCQIKADTLEEAKQAILKPVERALNGL